MLKADAFRYDVEGSDTKHSWRRNTEDIMT